MEEKFCQSCGMPMNENEEYGTLKDGSKSEDYCSYCFSEGSFTSESSMQEMIDICVPIVAEECGISKEVAKAQMEQFFPTLKRWQAD